MNPYTKIITKFHSALPVLRKWIEDLLETNKENTTSVFSLKFPRINQIFPKDLLERTKVMTVAGEVPFPPLSHIGLHELSVIEQWLITGITYKDTFFVNQNHRTESLHFHELIHVVQWERLGVDNFLLAYGVGLIQFGYEKSPLEQMAYTLQKNFDIGLIPNGIIDLIYKQTDDIWSQVEPLVRL
jgi:hypothetical protein